MTNTANNQPAPTTGPASQAYRLTNGKSYDPDAVYCESTDSKGHYEQLRIKLTPRLMNIIGEIVSDNDEFRTVHDFLRDAMLHQAHRWVTQRPPVNERLTRRIEAEAHAAQMDAILEEAKTMDRDIQTTHQVVMQAIADLDWYLVAEETHRVEELSVDQSLAPGIRDKYEQLLADLEHETARVRTRQIKARIEAKARDMDATTPANN